MTLFGRVTIFVTLTLSCVTAATEEAKGPLGPFNFGLRTVGYQSVENSEAKLLGVGTNFKYNFYKSYTFGVEHSYLSPYTVFDEYFTNGLNDLGIYVVDSALWDDKIEQISASLQFGAILPISQASRSASMKWGAAGSFRLRKGFGRRFALTYIVEGNTYEHEYNTAVEEEEKVDPVTGEKTPAKIIFNTRYDFLNRLNFTYNILTSLRVSLGVSAKNYVLYEDATANIYSISSLIAFDVAKGATIDLGVRSSVKNENDPLLFGAPPTSTRFFDPAGMVAMLGFSAEI